VVLILPLDGSGAGPEGTWLGSGVAEILRLGLSQHPGVVQMDPGRVSGPGQPEAWSPATVGQALKSVRGDVALFGEVRRGEGQFTVQLRLQEARGAEPLALEPVPLPVTDPFQRLPDLVVTAVRALKLPLGEAELGRIERAARPTRSVRAFELYSRAQQAAQRGGQEGLEAAADLLARAIEVDPGFVVAQYQLGRVHQALGNRWKAAAQFRAAIQLDPAYPEPYKALGDLLLGAPRRLFDQAVEAYQKAIERRPFYADAHVGLGDALAAKGEVDAAIAAYQRALTFNPVNPRVYVSLGRISYTEKGLYYEAVAAYRRAIELDPRFVEARMGLGEIYEDKGLYREAIEEYRRVIEVEPTNADALYNLALVYEKVDPREAIGYWERYIQLASHIPAHKDWVDIARQHLRRLKLRLKEP
jgi:tetratricopeptide (TPR) repeat protein